MTSYREAELKHGRIAMAATLGWIVQPRFHPLAKVAPLSSARRFTLRVPCRAAVS